MALRQHLESLRLEDGRPDVLARRAELESLFQTLSASEIRHFRPQFIGRTLQKDICGSLPLELLLSVSQYLELEDLQRAASVSHRWKEVFSSPEFHLGIVKLHFPLTWAAYQGLGSEQQNIHKQSLHHWLPEAALKRVKRLRGRYHSRSTYHYVNGDVKYSNPVVAPRYCNGRIAYQFDEDAIVVRGLRGEELTVFKDVNRVSLGRWLLSDDFLIVSTTHPAALLAWPLTAQESSGPYSIRLPSALRHISAFRDRVGIVLSKEVLLWHIGGEVKPVAGVKSQAGIDLHTLAVAFHPVDAESYFTVHYTSNVIPGTEGSSLTTFLVRNCVKGTKDTLHHFELPTPKTTALGSQSIVKLEDGSIGIMITDPTIDMVRREDSGLKRTLLVKFDPCRRFFSTESFHLPIDFRVKFDRSLYSFHFWRGQALIPISGIEPGVPYSEPLAQDVAVSVKDCAIICRTKDCQQHQEQKLSVYNYLADCGAAFGWPGCPQFTSQNEVYSAQGDDDFVILCAKDRYIVYCFDTDVELPNIASIPGPVLRRSRH